MNKNKKISNIELNIGESITKEKYIEIKGFIDHLNEMLTESEKTNNTILHKATEVYNKCTQYKQIIKNLTEKNKSLEKQHIYIVMVDFQHYYKKESNKV